MQLYPVHFIHTYIYCADCLHRLRLVSCCFITTTCFVLFCFFVAPKNPSYLTFIIFLPFFLNRPYSLFFKTSSHKQTHLLEINLSLKDNRFGPWQSLSHRQTCTHISLTSLQTFHSIHIDSLSSLSQTFSSKPQQAQGWK